MDGNRVQKKILSTSYTKRIDLPRLYGGASVKEKKIKTKQFVKKIAFIDKLRIVFMVLVSMTLSFGKQKTAKRAAKITFTETITDMAVRKE